MSVWLISATVLLFAMIPCSIVCLRGDAVDRLIGLEMAGVIEALIIVLLAQVFQRPIFYDLAIAVALLTFSAGMVFARFLSNQL